MNEMQCHTLSETLYAMGACFFLGVLFLFGLTVYLSKKRLKEYTKNSEEFFARNKIRSKKAERRE